MKIACLAWGSLLWKPGPLVLGGPWQDDGPRLPLEFCRVGDGGELATALCPGAALQASWWALLATDSLQQAREQLRQREEVDPDRPEWIGHAPCDPPYPFDDAIRPWMHARGLDAVVWTALPPRHNGVEGRAPGTAEAVDYLARLTGEVREHARDYIGRVPARFETDHRREIERRLGWTPHR